MKNHADRWIYLIASAFLAGFGVYEAPYLFTGMLSAENNNGICNAIGVSAGVVLLIILVAFLFCKKSETGRHSKKRFGKSLLRVLLTVLIFLVAAVVLGLLNGLIAVVINTFLKGRLAFDNIKLIIDIASVILFALAFPFFISVFWAEAYGSDSVWNALGTGLKNGCIKYWRLLLFCVVFAVLGMFAAQLNRFNSIWLDILTAVLLTVLGVFGFEISDKICSRK